MRTFSRDILVTLTAAIVIFLLLNATVQTSIVRYGSMEPGLEEGQRLLTIKVVYYFHEPERGDVIIFRSPNNPRENYIKRIIGLPGESVEIKQGTVYIHRNGDVLPLEEPYIKESPVNTFEGKIIPEGEYFVLGDNRNNSSDSRSGWTVKREDIIGKAWLSIWPPDKWGFVADYSLQEQLDSSMSK